MFDPTAAALIKALDDWSQNAVRSNIPRLLLICQAAAHACDAYNRAFRKVHGREPTREDDNVDVN